MKHLQRSQLIWIQLDGSRIVIVQVTAEHDQIAALGNLQNGVQGMMANSIAL